MDITRWSTLKSDHLYSLQPKMESFIQSVKTRPGADYGSDHELLISKLRHKFGPKSNPIQLYSGSDKQIQAIRSARVPEELWMEIHDIV